MQFDCVVNDHMQAWVIRTKWTLWCKNDKIDMWVLMRVEYKVGDV